MFSSKKGMFFPPFFEEISVVGREPFPALKMSLKYINTQHIAIIKTFEQAVDKTHWQTKFV
jgi:hypothetical protein